MDFHISIFCFQKAHQTTEFYIAAGAERETSLSRGKPIHKQAITIWFHQTLTA